MALNILNSKIQVVRAFTICSEPCSPYLYSCQLPAVNHKNTPCRAQDHAQSPSQKMPRTFLSLCSFVFNFADFLCVAIPQKLFFFHLAVWTLKFKELSFPHIQLLIWMKRYRSMTSIFEKNCFKRLQRTN